MDSPPLSPNIHHIPPKRRSRLQRMFSGRDDSSDTDHFAVSTSAASSDSRNSPPLCPPPRFQKLPDNDHQHHLRCQKRQEKLRSMLRDLLAPRKQRDDNEKLSLVNSWVEGQKLKKEPPLVEKYGKCQEIIGRGAFGVVRISHKQDTDNREHLYAVKEFRRRPQESAKKYTKRLTSEFCISSSLNHPNVIHTLDLLQDAKGDYCEVMEFCPGGDLYSLILASTKLDIEEADCFFKQLITGVHYLHQMGVAHRDLKPENLLLTANGALKITDFGNGECFRMAWEEEPHLTAGLCGSAPYIAPEEYTDKEFDPRAVDIWACGVIYMATRTGRHLWRTAKRDEDEFFERYLHDRKSEAGYDPIEQLKRPQCKNVIYSILDPNPTRRINAQQVLNSQWKLTTMPKAAVGTPKYLANKMKAKGLQRLRWYCQVCEKQCRDENGFRCHVASEGHVRQMLIVGENPRKHIQNYSSQFKHDFLQLLRTAHGEKRVHANQFYQEYISNKSHIHMNGTHWVTLTEFVKHLGREGICKVDQTEKGWYIAWVDNSPESIRRKQASSKGRVEKAEEIRENKLIAQQIERAKSDLTTNPSTNHQNLPGRLPDEKIKLDWKLSKPEITPRQKLNVFSKKKSIPKDISTTLS